MKLLALAFFFAVLTGCATSVTKYQWQEADFGEKLYHVEYYSYISRIVRGSLLDPGSLQLRCNDGKKGWLRDGLGPPQFGWVVYCTVNAKNRLGGYAGARPYFYLFRGDELLTYSRAAKRGFNYDFME